MDETREFNGRYFKVSISESTDGARPLWVGRASVVGRDIPQHDSFTTDACLSAAEASEKVQKWIQRWRP